MAQAPPYLLVSQNPSRSRPVSNVYHTGDTPGFSQNAKGPTTSSKGNPAPGTAPPFRAPAHKHAHHLHSIPPREKSVRTLIVDHMLWVHGECPPFPLLVSGGRVCFLFSQGGRRIFRHLVPPGYCPDSLTEFPALSITFDEIHRSHPVFPSPRGTRHD